MMFPTFQSVFARDVKPSVKSALSADNVIVSALAGGRVSDYLTVDTAYERVGWYRRCVDARADALSQMPFTIRSKSSGRVLYDSEGFKPLPDALGYVKNFRTLMKMKGISAVLKGRAYWQETEGENGIFYQWLAPDNIEEVYSETTGQITGYTRKIYNRKTGSHTEVSIPKESIVAFYEEDPRVEVGPPINILGESCRVNADVLYSIDRWLDGHMDRALMPSHIISLPSNTPPDERSRFQQIWDQKFRGKDKGGNQMVVNADTVTVQKIGEGIGEFGQSGVLREQREAIAATLGVPLSYLLPNAANRATAFQDDENFYTKQVIPEGKRAQDAINDRIFNPRGLVWRFEFKRIPALQHSELEKSRSLVPLVGKGRQIITVNEGRDFMGIESAGAEFDVLNAPIAPPSVMEPQNEEQQPLDERALIDIRKWKGKVERNGSAVPFESEDIPQWAHKAIRTRLDFGETAEEAFQPPYWNLR